MPPTTCPDCRQPVPRSAETCPECGRSFRPWPYRGVALAGAGILAVGAVAAVLVALRPEDRPAPAPARPAPAITPEQARKQSEPLREPPVPEAPTFRAYPLPPGFEPDPGYGLHVGDRAMLWKLYREGSVAVVARDWFAMRDLATAIEAGDREGLLDLMEAGRAIEAPLGAEALILEVHGDPDDVKDTDPVRVRVALTDGSTRQAWTPRVCVARPPR